MAKNNNKGFSLIEIIIAIAILTLLLTPILKQFAQTLEVNRLAKEQQYVNENASYILEYTQRSDLNDLTVDASVKTAATDLALAATAVEYKENDDPSLDTSISCQLYNIDGSEYATGANGTVKYNATVYTLNDVKLGAKKNVYHRNVVADDLAMKLMSKKTTTDADDGLQIAYGLTQDDLNNFGGIGNFVLTNEGSIVEYNDEGLVVKAVCTELVDGDSGNKYSVSNPNETSLGNMQDIDHTKVALITGNAASFDAQAEKAFYSKAMDNLKKVDPDSWKQGLTHVDGTNVLDTGNFGNTVIKLTKIYVNEVDGKYVVKVDVFYQNDYTFNGTSWYHDTLSYNVLSQTFNTNECPAIYFEYQPYTAEAKMSSHGIPDARYAKNDYIMIDSYVEGAKLYLYQPAGDQLNAVAYSGIANPDYVRDGYYVTTPGGSDKVIINMLKANSDVKDMEIYTNLNVCTKDSEFVNDSNGNPSISGSKTIDNGDGTTSTLKYQEFRASNGLALTKRTTTYAGRSAEVDLFENALTDERYVTGSTHGSDTYSDRAQYDIRKIKPLDQDLRYEDRALTITVRFIPTTHNMSTITLTGAKGAY